MGNVIDKTIYEDIASFYNLRTSNLIVLRKLLYFLATAEPGEVNINKLAKSLRKDNKTILEYLIILKKAGLIKFLLNNKSGHSLVRSLEKIYIDNTILLFAVNFHLGKTIEIEQIREVFTNNQLENADYKVFYAKNGDLVTDGFTFEIGGKNKSGQQIKDIENSYLLLDDIIIGDKNKIPLYLLGFLY